MDRWSQTFEYLLARLSLQVTLDYRFLGVWSGVITQFVDLIYSVLLSVRPSFSSYVGRQWASLEHSYRFCSGCTFSDERFSGFACISSLNSSVNTVNSRWIALAELCEHRSHRSQFTEVRTFSSCKICCGRVFFFLQAAVPLFVIRAPSTSLNGSGVDHVSILHRNYSHFYCLLSDFLVLTFLLLVSSFVVSTPFFCFVSISHTSPPFSWRLQLLHGFTF